MLLYLLCFSRRWRQAPRCRHRHPRRSLGRRPVTPPRPTAAQRCPLQHTRYPRVALLRMAARARPDARERRKAQRRRGLASAAAAAAAAAAAPALAPAPALHAMVPPLRLRAAPRPPMAPPRTSA
eukprot:365278-Chlamydomonas_euryale.AAC.4